MVLQPPGSTSLAPETRYSPDGHWWWDGAAWKPAYSNDRMWRWNGQGWVPARPAQTGLAGGPGLAVGLVAGVFVLVLVLVTVLVFAVMSVSNGSLSNIFAFS